MAEIEERLTDQSENNSFKNTGELYWVDTEDNTQDPAGSGFRGKLLNFKNWILSGLTLAWGSITGKPATFPPSSHTHAQSEITDLVTDLTLKADLVSGKVPASQLELASETVAGIGEIASQAESETAADTTLGNRNHDKFFTARDFRWAFNKVLTDVALTFSQIITFVQTPVFNRNFRHIPTSIATFSANQNNLDLSTTSGIVFISASTPINITGIVAEGFTGIRKEIINVDNGTGNQPITFVHESASSTSTNRFITPTGQNVILNPKQRAFITYVTHGGVSRWLVEVVDYDALTGYSVGADTALVATDSRIAGFGKIQGQINARLSLSGGNLTGVLNQAKGANKASAATVDLATVTGDTVHITGTTAITSFGTVQAGAKKTLIFDGILILTHNATSLILPSGANITTAVGDVAQMVSEGSGNWKCEAYTRANGKALIGSGGVDLGSVSNPKTPAELGSEFGSAAFDDKVALIISTVNYGYYRKTASSWELVQTKPVQFANIAAWSPYGFMVDALIGTRSSPANGNISLSGTFTNGIPGKGLTFYKSDATIPDLDDTNSIHLFGEFVEGIVNKVSYKYKEGSKAEREIFQEQLLPYPLKPYKNSNEEGFISGINKWATAVDSGGSCSQGVTGLSVANMFGIGRCRQNTAGNKATWKSGNDTLLLGHRPITLVGNFMIPALSNAAAQGFYIKLGLASSDAKQPSEMVAIEYSDDINSGKPNCLLKSGGGTTSQDSTASALVANTRYEWRLEFNRAGTSVKFWIDDVLRQTLTTNIPPNTQPLRAYFGLWKEEGASDSDLYCDDFDLYIHW